MASHSLGSDKIANPPKNRIDGRIDEEALDNYVAFDNEVRKIESDLDDALWNELLVLQKPANPEPEQDESVFEKAAQLRNHFRFGSDLFTLNSMYDRITLPREGKIRTGKTVRKRGVETILVTQPEQSAGSYELLWNNRINLKSPWARTQAFNEDNRMLGYKTLEGDEGMFIATLKITIPRLMNKYELSDISIRARGPGNRLMISGRHERPLGLTDEHVIEQGDNKKQDGDVKPGNGGGIFFREFTREFILPLGVDAKAIKAARISDDLVIEIPIPFRHRRKSDSPIKEIPILFD